MAISAEQLNIILTAKDKAFAAAMDKNAKRIDSFAKNANKDLGMATAGFDKLAKGVAAFATLAGIQQLGTMVRDAANKLGDLKDASEAIGITTDAMQELTYAAQLSGVSSDLLQTSLAKLSKNLGDAAMGGSAAKKALDTLGLSGASLAAMPLDKALGVVADKMSKIENPAQRAALATELFGKSGLKMVNMLAEGSAGLNAMAAEARSLGVVINQDVIANSAEAADKLDALSMVVSANLTQALVNLGPVIIAAAQGLATMSQAVKDFLNSGGTGLPPVMNREEIGAAADEYNALRKEFDAFYAAQARVNAIDVMYDQGITVDLKEEAKAVADLAAAEDALAKAKENLAQKRQAEANITETVTAMQAENKALEEQIRLQKMSAEERIREAAARERDAFINKLIEQGQVLNDGPISDEAVQKIEALADAHEKLYIEAELSKIAQTGANKGMSDAAIIALKTKDALAVYQAQVQNLGLTMSEFETISSTIQSSMEDAFMGMVDGTSSAKDAFRSMAADIIKELYRVLVVQRMVGQLATAGKAGSGLLGFIGGALGITGSAAGGPLQAGQPSVVGEHGRELFVPSSAGRVLSVPQSKAAVNGGGGVTVIQNINVSTGVQQTVRAEIKSLMPQISDSAKAAVLDAKRRGGSYGSAF
jgi:hypothetical protein